MKKERKELGNKNKKNEKKENERKFMTPAFDYLLNKYLWSLHFRFNFRIVVQPIKMDSIFLNLAFCAVLVPVLYIIIQTVIQKYQIIMKTKKRNERNTQCLSDYNSDRKYCLFCLRMLGIDAALMTPLPNFRFISEKEFWTQRL